ncbi:MAG: hypothetical protein RIR26_17, partial [Pseudomonadota bacterium]
MSKMCTTSGCLLIFALLAGCWPKDKNTEDSELDAISAASHRIFGKNVRGYMWALTTDSPALFAQAPEILNSASGTVSDSKFTETSASAPAPSSEFFQCWYYAETEVYEHPEGEGLRKLFLDKAKTKKVNNNFIDVRALYQ